MAMWLLRHQVATVTNDQQMAHRRACEPAALRSAGLPELAPAGLGRSVGTLPFAGPGRDRTVVIFTTHIAGVRLHEHGGPEKGEKSGQHAVSVGG